MKKLILTVVLCVLFCTPVYAGELDSKYKAYVALTSAANDIDPYVHLALIETESGNNPDAVNSDGSCFGLCQVHRCHTKKALSMGLGDPTTDVYANIAYSSHMLSTYYHELGDWNKTLVKYNAGYIYAESSAYSRKILARAEELREKDFEDARLRAFEEKGAWE